MYKVLLCKVLLNYCSEANYDVLASLSGPCPVFQYGKVNNERLDTGPANEATFVLPCQTEVYRHLQSFTKISRFMYKCVVFLQLWPVISSVCTTYQADQRIIERTCRYGQTDSCLVSQCHILQGPVSHCYSHHTPVQRYMVSWLNHLLAISHIPFYRCIRFMIRCVGKSAANIISPLATMVRAALL